MAEARVCVSSLAHRYRGREALKGVSFSVPAGQVFGLLGPNGGGKSTLFRILSTLLVPSSGSAQIGGADVVRERQKVREQIGVVFQNPSLDKKLGVRENLVHQGHLYGLWGAELARRIDEVLGRFGLLDRQQDRVEALSGGLARRVELAKCVLHRPRVLLLDEPSTGLDPGARRTLSDLLAELAQKDGVTVLLTTHILEEAERCHRLGILHQGELVALGTPSELRQEVGGEVLSITGAEPARLCAQIEQRFGAKPQLVNGVVRCELPRAHELIPKLVETFPGQIDTVTMGHPTLEDVFVRRTGCHLSGEANS